MEIKGEVVRVKQVETWNNPNTGKLNAKLGFVVKSGRPGYERDVYLQVWGRERVDKVDIRVGDSVTAQVDAESREHNGKFYTDLKVWKLEKQ